MKKLMVFLCALLLPLCASAATVVSQHEAQSVVYVGRTYWLMYITLLRLALSKRAQIKSESHSVLWLSW